MKKSLKIFLIILVAIIVLEILFFSIKYIRENNSKEETITKTPFCLEDVEIKDTKYNYSKVIDNTSIKLKVPDNWNYEEIENSNTKFSLNFYKSSKDQNATLEIYDTMFGVCGTGLRTEKITLDDGTEACVGYYDNSQIWNFISFSNQPNIAIINNELDETESQELLELVKTISITSDNT